MTAPPRYKLDEYVSASPPPVFNLIAVAHFSPLDINIAFLTQNGWNQTVDRIRFHVQNQNPPPSSHPLAAVLGSLPPNLMIRRLDAEEGRFISLQISIDGTVNAMSNDRDFAIDTFNRLLLDCPPAFHTVDEFAVSENWVTDSTAIAYFLGMLSGAQGWDPSHNIPHTIRQSLDEAHTSLESANFRSSVVMSRRTMEAVLKFGFSRLLGREPVDRRGRGLMLNDLITQFRNESTKPIPEHLLHIADSVRLVGNVPGAHATEIPNYHFSRSDAEYALYGVSHFLHEYFNKIDKDVAQYYTLTIDLTEPETEPEAAK